MKAYAAIMAGGSGTRLWPVSRENNPKQLHSLVSKNSLLQDTIKDINGIVDEKNVLIVTGKRYEKAIKKQLPKVNHYLFEPYKLGKTLAIGLAALYLSKLDPKAVMILLWSDSFIGDKTTFKKTVKDAVKFASSGQNLIIGVKPTDPSTAYGYIEMGTPIKNNLRKLKAFKEKPDLKTAQKYVKTGKFVWNPGISVWRVDKLLELYAKFEPAVYKAIMKYEKNIHTKNLVDTLAKDLKNVPKTEIEETIYPKAEDLGVIPAQIGWNDIGNWGAIHDILSSSKNNTIVVGNHLGIDNKNTLVYSQNRFIATIGLEDIVVIDTPDVTLVAKKNKAQDVKKIVEALKNHKDNKKLL